MTNLALGRMRMRANLLIIQSSSSLWELLTLDACVHEITYRWMLPITKETTHSFIPLSFRPPSPLHRQSRNRERPCEERKIKNLNFVVNFNVPSIEVSVFFEKFRSVFEQPGSTSLHSKSVTFPDSAQSMPLHRSTDIPHSGDGVGRQQWEEQMAKISQGLFQELWLYGSYTNLITGENGGRTPSRRI